MGEMCIEGSGGTLTLDGDGNIRLRQHDSNEWQTIDYQWQDRDYAGDCVYLVQQHVLDHLQQGIPLVNSAKDYLTNLRIEEAVYQSADCGSRIDLPATEA